MAKRAALREQVPSAALGIARGSLLFSSAQPTSLQPLVALLLLRVPQEQNRLYLCMLPRQLD